MTEYSKVQKRIWNSKTFLSLSEDAKFLWLYLLTCPHGNMIGLFVLKSGYAQEDLDWTQQRFTKSFNELLGKQLSNGCLGLIKYDEDTKVLWIKNFLEHNPLKNPNQVTSAVNKIKDLPYSELFEDVKLFIKQLGKQLYEPLHKQFAKPVAVTVAVDVTVTNNTYVDQPIKIPYQKMVDTYHEILPELTEVRKLTEKRKLQAKKIWLDKDMVQDIEKWRSYLNHIRKSKFLMGQIDGKTWQADFEWITNYNNFVKIIEGKYHP